MQRAVKVTCVKRNLILINYKTHIVTASHSLLGSKRAISIKRISFIAFVLCHPNIISHSYDRNTEFIMTAQRRLALLHCRLSEKIPISVQLIVKLGIVDLGKQDVVDLVDWSIAGFNRLDDSGKHAI